MRRRQFLSLTGAAAAAAAAAAAPIRGIARAAGVRKGVARVVVVGGGFAGASCAMALGASCDVTLIDPDERYVTCPMSNAVIVGLRDLDSITVTREGLRRRSIRVVGDRVTAIDARLRRVHLSRGAAVRYDRLVMAPGIRMLWGKPDGYTEAVSARIAHAWQAGAQTQLLAAQLSAMPRAAWLRSAYRRDPCAALPGRSSGRA